MNKYYIIVFLLIQSFSVLIAQEVDVLTLATFHFAFHNRDIQKIENDDQINVLKPEHQNEIEKIAGMISTFKPTIIAIEVDPIQQTKIDSLYNDYLNGKYQLSREESEQIGFRLAKQNNIKKLYCVNDWGKLPEQINNVVYGNDTFARQKFMDFFYNNPDSLKIYEKEDVYKTKGILEELRELNSDVFLKKDLGNYLISVFKYETDENEFFGVDFTTGWWFNRNLKIFRNIQKIPTKPDDRILVIYGSGHMNILNILFDASPEYRLVKANDYLK
jgi:hypothetical protein